MNYDAIVVGCGFSGAVVARRLAEERGARVLVAEKRATVGGNMYDEPDEAGILVHRYGPHIFHTHSERVFSYIRRFSEWRPYEHRVLGRINGRLVPIPFNFTSLDALFEPEDAAAIRRKARAAFPGRGRVSVLDLLRQPDADIRRFGQFVFDRVFQNYTAKQWGTPIDRVDPATINRVPVALGRDDRYFTDPIQMMPKNGYTALFRRLLDHPRITVRLGCDAVRLLAFDRDAGRVRWEGAAFSGPVVYTGCVDELLGYRFGPLPYRSLDMRFEVVPAAHFQPAAVVNYPNEEPFTRITEFKYLTGQRADCTTIMREYPLPYDKDGPRGNLPFYPIISAENRAHYEKYAGLLRRYSNFHLCGRLADYRYYNMDAAILHALELADRIAAGWADPFSGR